VVKHIPRHSGIWLRLKAVDFFKQSLELESEQIATLMNLALALKSVGKKEEADAALANAAKLTPTEPQNLMDNN